MTWPSANAPEQVTIALCTWLASVTGGTVVREPYRGARPSKPYLGVTYQTAVRRGRPEAFVTEDDDPDDADFGQAVTRSQEEAVFQLMAYGDTALGVLSSVRIALADSEQRTAAHELGFAIGDVGTVTRMPELLDTDWEERAMLELRVAYTVEDTARIGVIESVDATVTAGDLSFDIDVPPASS